MTRRFNAIIKSKRPGAVFFGDWHADLSFSVGALERAIEKYPDIDVFYHVGDFGIGFGNERFPAMVADIMESAGKTLIITGGNHENWDMWDKLTKGQKEPYVFPGEGLVLLPKMYRWKHAEWQFVSLGGASSIDRQSRVPGYSWWPQELISDEAVLDALRVKGEVDVLITHESSADPVPPVQAILDNPFAQLRWPHEDIQVGAVQQEKVSTVVEGLKPKHHFHGHWHIPYIRPGEETTTVSLGANYASYAENSYAIQKF